MPISWPLSKVLNFAWFMKSYWNLVSLRKGLLWRKLIQIFAVYFKRQSIVGTELFPFNSRSVHVHERNFGHFFKGNSVMNMNGTLVTFSQWTECKSLFIFSVRAEHIFAKKAFETFLSKHIFHFFLKKSFGFKCCWIIKQINFRWITKWHHP